jgi:hypothetical protein
MAEGIAGARDAFDRQAWGWAYDGLSTAAVERALERLAAAAYLIGRSDESAGAWARAHQECARIGDVARAVGAHSGWPFSLLNSGELVFTKLRPSSRAAATAYAYTDGLTYLLT